jgi:hypothetical protein
MNAAFSVTGRIKKIHVTLRSIDISPPETET